jgi:hypothetical protein
MPMFWVKTEFELNMELSLAQRDMQAASLFDDAFDRVVRYTMYDYNLEKVNFTKKGLNKSISKGCYPICCKLLEENGVLKKTSILRHYKFTDYGKNMIMMRYML